MMLKGITRQSTLKKLLKIASTGVSDELVQYLSGFGIQNYIGGQSQSSGKLKLKGLVFISAGSSVGIEFHFLHQSEFFTDIRLNKNCAFHCTAVGTGVPSEINKLRNTLLRCLS